MNLSKLSLNLILWMRSADSGMFAVNWKGKAFKYLFAENYQNDSDSYLSKGFREPGSTRLISLRGNESLDQLVICVL